MAQQTSTLTRSNLNSVTSVSPLDHESSPKNDASRACTLLQARKTLRGAHSLSHLVKKVRRQKETCSPRCIAKRKQIDELKQSGLYLAIREIIGGKRAFTYHDIEQLMQALNQSTSLSNWSFAMFGGGLYHGIVVYASYQSVTPALVFKATGTGYVVSSFHFNYGNKKD